MARIDIILRRLFCRMRGGHLIETRAGRAIWPHEECPRCGFCRCEIRHGKPGHYCLDAGVK